MYGSGTFSPAKNPGKQQQRCFSHRTSIGAFLLPSAWTAQAQGENPTILFIDDDPFQALAYTAALEGRFHHVRRVASPVEAFCLVEDPKIASRLDLLISAHHWPGMSGPDFVAELHRRLPSVPVLVLVTDQDAAEHYPAFGDQLVFLDAPITTRKLVEAVGAILGRSFRDVA